MKEMEKALEQFRKAEKLKVEGKYLKSIDFCKNAMSIFDEMKDWERHINCLNLWSENLWHLGLDKEGIEKATFALEEAEKHLGKHHHILATSYNSLGLLYSRKSESKAIQYFKKALYVWSLAKGTEHHYVARFYNNIGNCFSQKGQYYEAIQYYQKGVYIQLLQQDKNELGIAMSYNNLSISYLNIRQYEKALELCNKALKIRLQLLGKKHPYVANSYNNIGLIYYEKKDNDKALQFHKRALNIWQQKFNHQHPYIAYGFNNMGLDYFSKKNYKTAVKYHQKALTNRLQNLGKLHPYTVHSFNNLGMCYFKKGNFKKALEYHQQALQSNIPLYSPSSKYHLPKLSKYLSGELILETIHSKSSIFHSEYRKSFDEKLLAASLFTTQIALKWLEHIRQSLFNESSKMILAKKSYDIFKNGIQIAHNAAQIATEKPQEWKTVTKENAQINHDSWNKEDFDYCWTAHDCLHSAFDICEKSRAMVLLGNIQEEKAKGSVLIPKDLLEKEYDLKVELNYYDKKIKQEEYKREGDRNKVQLREWQNNFFDYKQEYDVLIEHLEKEYPNYYELKYQVETVRIEQLQSQLNVSKSLTSTSTAILQYFIGKENLYLFTITATDYQVFEISKPKDFEELIQDFLYNINKRIKADYLELGYELYELLFTPAISQLDLKKGTQLVIIPDGILNQVPFEALLTQKVKGNPNYADLPYLLIKYDVSYHFSATLWHRSSLQQQKQANQTQVLEDNFIGFAPVYVSKKERGEGEEVEDDENDEQKEELLETVLVEETRDIKIGDENYKSLIHSEKEVQQIAQLFQRRSKKAIMQLHEQATTQHFIDKTPFFKYILVAAHADFQVSRPELTGIIFSPEANATEKEIDELGIRKTYYDHILYLSDTYHLNLQNTDLLVLSCCETGIGKLEQGEGVMALHRGFLFAGAKNIVYTLFKIPDKQSSELTQALFRYILEGKSYRSALRLAKLELIAKREMPPVYWSGFVLIGA